MGLKYVDNIKMETITIDGPMIEGMIRGGYEHVQLATGEIMAKLQGDQEGLGNSEPRFPPDMNFQNAHVTLDNWGAASQNNKQAVDNIRSKAVVNAFYLCRKNGILRENNVSIYPVVADLAVEYGEKLEKLEHSGERKKYTAAKSATTG
jgi:hypothetical protein